MDRHIMRSMAMQTNVEHKMFLTLWSQVSTTWCRAQTLRWPFCLLVMVIYIFQMFANILMNIEHASQPKNVSISVLGWTRHSELTSCQRGQSWGHRNTGWDEHCHFGLTFCDLFVEIHVDYNLPMPRFKWSERLLNLRTTWRSIGDSTFSKTHTTSKPWLSW